MTRDDLAMAMAKEVTRKVADGKKVSSTRQQATCGKQTCSSSAKKRNIFSIEKKKNRPAHAFDMSLRIVIVDVRKEAMTHFAARGHLVARYGGSRPVVSVLP